ncbi:MAG: hypothetical protein JWO78_2316 [Micavibrio sp.]|nr:hypothetical protein [Micavibrio sp.]
MADVKLEPYKRNGENLIADIRNGAASITDKQYHEVRDKVMNMRAHDPATANMYDKYLTEVVKNKKEWPTADIEKLNTSLNKSNLGLSHLTNDISKDLKAHGYSSSYRPPLVIDVNGHPMHPEVVADNLRAKGIEPAGEIPRSAAPGKISGGGLAIKAGDAVKLADDMAVKATERGFSKTANLLMTEVAEHGRRFGIVGKVIGAGVAGTMAFAGGASAAEIGKDSVNAVAPGLGTLALGDGPKHGVLCQAFGQVTGALAGVGAGLGVGALTSWTGPGALIAGGATGIATEAAVTPAVTWACNKFTR